MTNSLIKRFASLTTKTKEVTEQEVQVTSYPLVSVIIAARNNALFLPETIDSCLHQSVPVEIIYSDDSSYDNSLEIAKGYEEAGVTVLRGTNNHSGVCTARSRGAAVAHGEYLVFLDGDDQLPYNFIEKHLSVMGPGIPFVYGPAQAFNSQGDLNLWPAPEWKDYDLWRCNTVNTSAMYTRWAFNAAGGWSDAPRTMWDWDLAIRAQRFGTPKRSPAILRYRQHSDSWSHVTTERAKEHHNEIAARIRRRLATVSIGTVFSGRLTDLVPKWFSAISLSAYGIDSTVGPDLTILNNSRSYEATIALETEANRYCTAFNAIRIIPFPKKLSWKTELERRDQVAGFMAEASNILSYEMLGDIHWLIEDDILVPQLAGKRLWEAITVGEKFQLPNAIAGCYRNRHLPKQYVAGYWNTPTPVEITSLPENDVPFKIDIAGTGCLMYWKDRTPREWKSHVRGVPAHDWAWCIDLKEMGGELLLHPSIRCGHAVLSEQIIEG